MTLRFKKGDKAKITNNHELLRKISLRADMAGDIITITNIRSGVFDSSYDYKFIWRGQPDWGINEEQLETVIPNWKRRLNI